MRSSSAAALGTIATVPTGSPSEARESAFSTSTSVPPQQSVPKISAMDTSKQTEVEARTETRSSSDTVSFSQRSTGTVLRCSICTPLGRPVDPEV